MFIPFAEYAPDLSSLNSKVSGNIRSCIPYGDGYLPFPTPDAFSVTGLDDRPQGVISVRDASGTTYLFAGDASKLYSQDSTGWEDVSKSGGYTTGADEQWHFTQYGRTVYATNFTDPVQAYTMGTSTDFADLAGSPPRARYCSVIKDFLVLANLDTGTSRVQWGPLGNPAGTWGTDPATGADYQDLDTTRGWIKAIVGGEYGVVFQERAISRMTFEGPPTWFRFDEVETGRGTQSPGSVVKAGNIIYYIDTDLSFQAFNGTSSIPIGVNKVDKFFRDTVDTNYLHRISSCRDPRLPIVYWAFSESGNFGGRPDNALAYNWINNRWSIIDYDSFAGSGYELLFNTFAEGYTLDQLDSVSSSIDALDYSLDSSIWTGGQLQLSTFSGSNRLSYFNGPSAEATLETPEFQLFPLRRGSLQEFRPFIEGVPEWTNEVSATVYERNDLSQSATAVGVGNTDDGFYHCRSNARYHKISIVIGEGSLLDNANTFSNAIGVEITKAFPSGAR